jgi:hypothetical protein
MVLHSAFARFLCCNEEDINAMEHTLTIVPAGTLAKTQHIMNHINLRLPMPVNRNKSTKGVKIANEVLSQVASTINEMDEYYRTGAGTVDLSVVTIEALMKHMFTNCSQTIRYEQIEKKHRDAAYEALGLMQEYFRESVYDCFLESLERNMDTMGPSRVFPRPANY